jgi:serine/threonine protein kinase
MTDTVASSAEKYTRDLVNGTGYSLEPGTLFANRYLINEIVGRGGMATVYKAEDIELKQAFALKIIHH